MKHITSIGLDVHARSVTAAAFNPVSGEVVTKRFGNSPEELASWISGFESPKAVYESGVTGFYLARELRAKGIDCVVGAISRMHKPAADKSKKNDRNDAIFLSRMLASNNIVEVMVPDEECEAMRDIARTLEDIRDDLTRAKQRLTKFLMRHGYVFDELNDNGQRKGNWTQAHWAWIRKIKFAQAADEDTLAYYISEVRHFENHKKTIERYIRDYAKSERWTGRIEALRCLKGIETMTAFAVVVEAQVFSRFDTASAFAAWLGLVPSEHSSGENSRKGGITKTGNSHIRKLLIEAAWHYVRATSSRKRDSLGDVVALRTQNHAAKGIKRLAERRRYLHTKGKKPVVANCATARELACWVWAIGCMSEGTL
ncbi:IS110 family transposase [Actinomycetota bacterium]|nr:IS110 family transposase [Actinomycetota bacterium]